MKIYSTSQRLKQLMDARQIRQVDILEAADPYCRAHGVALGKNDLSQYVSGKVEPGQKKLTILGLALGVSEAWLMGYDVPMQRNITPTTGLDDIHTSEYIKNLIPIETKKIPLLGTIAAGEPIYADEDFESYVEVGAGVRCDFALRVKGDSMINARIHDGDIVFIRKQDTVNQGEIAVVLIGDEATLKRFRRYGNHIVLQSENPEIHDIEFELGEDVNMKILGKAVAFQGDVR